MIWEFSRSDQVTFFGVKMAVFCQIVAVGYFFGIQLLQGLVRLKAEVLRNSCKRAKIPNVVDMRGAEDYEPSYLGIETISTRNNF